MDLDATLKTHLLRQKPSTFPYLHIKITNKEETKPNQLSKHGTLSRKLGRSLEFPSRLENRHPNSKAMWASLSDFRSKIDNFLNQIFLKPEPGMELMSLTWFHNCFELIHISNKAFAKLVVEIDYPMSKWSCKSTEEYLNYTLNLLDLLNSISSSISHLNMAKISIVHGLNLISQSRSSASKPLKRIPRKDLEGNLKMVNSIGIEEFKSGFDHHKESLVLEGLIVLKKIGFLALGLVLSGLSSDSKPYMEIRKFFGVFNDSLIEGMDSRFFTEIMEMKGVVAEVKKVNSAVELVNGGCDEAVKELKRRIEVMEDSIELIEKEANNMFSEVLATRNKLIDNIKNS